MKINFVTLGLALAATWCCRFQYAPAQDTQSDHGPKATIEEVAWISGQWSGEAMEGESNTVIFNCHRADSKTSPKPKTTTPTKQILPGEDPKQENQCV